ncbi:hypothetical protein D3C73_739730 [compost metagenome]
MVFINRNHIVSDKLRTIAAFFYSLKLFGLQIEKVKSAIIGTYPDVFIAVFKRFLNII